jgi:hypothetical protein
LAYRPANGLTYRPTQQIGFSMCTADNIPRPFVEPSRLALAIIRGLRGERVQTAPHGTHDGIRVPSR